ncbi:hypothetical protein VP1G_01851 [Cytospora mali]|uniref:Uncharacterized protein n=1 Tax=Cytospora mali TaxID=578113 RepID=A0A194USA3_CYTMA|nr:hypothetical protein VP1G_01851 [Valsa mali var. pyri (nom. inval.)]
MPVLNDQDEGDIDAEDSQPSGSNDCFMPSRRGFAEVINLDDIEAKDFNRLISAIETDPPIAILGNKNQNPRPGTWATKMQAVFRKLISSTNLLMTFESRNVEYLEKVECHTALW